MSLRHPMGVLYSFSIKNIFYNKMLKAFLFSYDEFVICQLIAQAICRF